MKKEEFERTMEKIIDDDYVLCTRGVSSTVYSHNGLLWEHFNYYAVAHGYIPYEFAKYMYDKYFGDDNLFHPAIRIAGDGAGTNKETMKTAFYHDKRGRKYTLQYHIDNVESLILFMLEWDDYYRRKHNLPETRMAQFDEYMEKCIGRKERINEIVESIIFLKEEIAEINAKISDGTVRPHEIDLKKYDEKKLGSYLELLDNSLYNKFGKQKH